MNFDQMGGGRGPEARAASAGEAGTSFVDLVLVLATVVLVASLLVPVTAHVADTGRARHAAGFLASRLRLARQQAVFTTRSVGLVFDLTASRWTFRVCTDKDGDGLRRADISAGQDTCEPEAYDLASLFPGMTVMVDPALPGPAGEPGSADPVRLGSSDMASFSPTGSCTAGTIFLRSTDGVQYAVRVANTTGRTRILRYETGTRQWTTV